MKVLLRADASVTQGTGHVMRCLTLGDELHDAGHDVHLATSDSHVAWLESLVSSKPFTRHVVSANSLDIQLLEQVEADWLVVDSYEIPVELIERARDYSRVLAIVDGNARGISADLFVDHNVGAENLEWPETVKDRLLAGSRFALVRRAIRNVKRQTPWRFEARIPRILGVMGGSDPTGMIVDVASALASLGGDYAATLVCAPQWRSQVDAVAGRDDRIKVIEPTDELPALLAKTDIAISAAGTSSWELCTLAIPSILIEVVDNQVEGLREMTAQGLVIGLSPSALGRGAIVSAVAENVQRLMSDEPLRRSLSDTCTMAFDGLGPSRIVHAMQSFPGVQSAHR